MAEFDMSLVQRGARNRRTPYYEATQKYSPLGYTVYNHMYFPIRFDSFENEFESLLNDVTVWDVSVERCLEISGPDGFTFAQLLTPRDLSKCAVGQAKYVLICDSDGGIINDPVLTRMDENTFWFALASSDALLFARGLKNAYPDLDVTIKEADVAPLQVQGPKSKDLMVKLLGESILDLKYYFWTRGRDRRRARRRHPHRLDVRGGLRDLPRRTRRKGTEVYEAIMKAGDDVQHQAHRPERHPSHRGRHLQLGRRHDLRQQRVRAGARPPGRLRLADATTRASPLAAYRKIQDAGVARKIERRGDRRGARSRRSTTSSGPSRPTAPRSARSRRRSTRRAWSKNIGYCWLPTEYANLGTVAGRLDASGGTRNGIVVEMPFVDPTKEIPVS